MVPEHTNIQKNPQTLQCEARCPDVSTEPWARILAEFAARGFNKLFTQPSVHLRLKTEGNNVKSVTTSFGQQHTQYTPSQRLDTLNMRAWQEYRLEVVTLLNTCKAAA